MEEKRNNQCSDFLKETDQGMIHSPVTEICLRKKAIIVTGRKRS